MKRRLLELGRLVALTTIAAVTLGAAALHARPPETLVGGPAGAPNLTADKTLKLVAQWSLTKTRYYRLDYDGGRDNPACYIDATAGAELSSAGPTPCKTFDYLLTILPHSGNGRSVVTLVKPRASGATYRNSQNTADAAFNMTGISGYSYFLVRGSTDLTNVAADRLTLGAITGVTGPGGGGAYTVAGGGTTTAFSVSAGSFGSSDAIVGHRWRFDAATSTAALRNVSCFVAANTGTQITCGANLGTAPAAGDTGYVERPGVRVGTLTVSATQATTLTGIAVTAAADSAMSLATSVSVGAAFLESTGSTTEASLAAYSPYGGTITIARSYLDEAGTSRSVGSGLRSNGGASVSAESAFLSALAFTSSSAAAEFSGTQVAVGAGGSYFAAGPTIYGGSSVFFNTFGTSSASERVTRATGPVTVYGFWLVRNATIASSATSGIVFGSATRSPGAMYLTTVTGTGNTSVGVDGSAARGSQISLASDCTITGTGGDLKLAGGAIAATADLQLSNVIDSNGNDWRSSTATGTIVGPATLVTNKNGSALAVGNVVRDNGTSGQVTKAQADTAAHATGSMCVMVTSPANNADGYMVCTGVPYVLFDGAPTMGAPSYLSTGTAGKLTSTIPALSGTNQKLRFSYPTSTSGSTARVQWEHELLPVGADGTL